MIFLSSKISFRGGGRGSLRPGRLCLFGVHSTLGDHGGLWEVLQSRFFGSGDLNIALISGAVGMMGHKNKMCEILIIFRAAPVPSLGD